MAALNIVDLPAELLFHIFDKSDMKPEHRLAFGLTCRTAHNTLVGWRAGAKPVNRISEIRERPIDADIRGLDLESLRSERLCWLMYGRSIEKHQGYPDAFPIKLKDTIIRLSDISTLRPYCTCARRQETLERYCLKYDCNPLDDRPTWWLPRWGLDEPHSTPQHMDRSVSTSFLLNTLALTVLAMPWLFLATGSPRVCLACPAALKEVRWDDGPCVQGTSARPEWRKLNSVGCEDIHDLPPHEIIMKFMVCGNYPTCCDPDSRICRESFLWRAQMGDVAGPGIGTCTMYWQCQQAMKEGLVRNWETSGMRRILKGVSRL